MDDVTWGALTLTLTLVGGIWTWWAFRRRGAASGVRGAAFTLLPAAAWLTGTLEMFTEIGGSIADWATSLVLSPTVWAGIILAGVSGGLFAVSGMLRDKSTRARPAVGEGPGQAPPALGKGQPAIDDDLADIEAILRKRGIT